MTETLFAMIPVLIFAASMLFAWWYDRRHRPVTTYTTTMNHGFIIGERVTILGAGTLTITSISPDSFAGKLGRRQKNPRNLLDI